MEEIPDSMIEKHYWKRPNYIREFSIDRIKNGKTYSYPSWYWDTKEEVLKKKICQSCGDSLPKGKRSYCGEIICHGNATINSLGVSSVRREVHKRFGFACTNCGEMFIETTQAGVQIPQWGGECHHIIPLEYGGEDEFDNITLLCYDCHKDEHKRLRKERKIKPKSNTQQLRLF